MPLLRFSLYSQNVNLYLAPTADARDTWLPLMRTIACEGRAYVLSANQCVRRKNLPAWIKGDMSADPTDQSKSSHPNPQLTKRRKSSIVKTTDNHEIVLPNPSSTTSESKPGTHASASAPHTSSSLSKAESTSSVPDAAVTDEDDDFVSQGGSCIIGPMGDVLVGPLWGVEDGGLLIVDVDFEECERGRLDLDVAGSYSRNDAFRLSVEGLDLNPPP